MLKISTQHSSISFGYEEALKVLSEAGFEAADLSVTGRVIAWDEGFFTDITSPEFAEYFRNVGKCAKDNNVEVCMTHAPYCSTYISDMEAYAKVQQQTIRAIYATKIIESPYIVVHPVLHSDFNNGQNKERCFQTNVDYFSALVPALKETGVVACIENLFMTKEGQPKIPNACSKAGDLAELIDTLNAMHGACFAACLDTGHAVITGEDPCHMLKVLGHRTKVLHIHDNDGVRDSHTAPGTGVIDWEALMRTLKEVDYNGVFNFETDCYWTPYKKGYYNHEVIVSAAKLLYDMGRALLEIE